MKKVIIISLVFYSLFSNAQYPNNGREMIERSLKNDAAKFDIYQKTQAKQYHQIINELSPVFNKFKDENNLNIFEGLALVNSFLAIDKKDSAYHYAQMITEMLKEYKGDLFASSLNYSWDYFVFHHLASDEDIRNYIFNGFINYYRALNYPLSDMGVQILWSHYFDQQLSGLYFYNINGITDSVRLRNEDNISSLSKIPAFDHFYTLYANRDRVYSEEEIGIQGYAAQNFLILHGINEKEEMFVPMLNKSYEKGEVSGFEVVYILMRTLDDFTGYGDREMYQHLKDSLCQVYDCNVR